MAEREVIPQCPPCGADSLLPLCRALVVATWQESPPQGEEKDFEAFGPQGDSTEVFSTRRPRDAIAGASSGLKTVARSFAAGASALLCGPSEGAKTGSAVGMLLGAGEGVASAFLLPCAGTLLGMAQCARGIANTPQALLEPMIGKEWSQKERQWVTPFYNLPEEVTRLERKRVSRDNRGRRHDADESDSPNSSGSRSRHHTHSDASSSSVRTVQRHGPNYYEILRVQPAASLTELRRAYYSESRRCHPDKVGAENLQAVAQFQLLAEAYKVLRNPELRRAYDVGGREEVVRMSTTVDIGKLYSAVLSGDQWEPYIGRLALCRILASGEDDDATALDSLISLCCVGDMAHDLRQAEREVRCATALAERLHLAVEGETDRFEQFVEQEADRLAGAPFAPALMYAIVAVYQSEAASFLGALHPMDARREFAQAMSHGRLVRQQSVAAVAGMRAVMVLQSLAESEQKGTAPRSPDEHPRTTTLCLERPAVQAQLPILAAALWRLTVLDVEGTLRRVCRRVLRDSSIGLEDRVCRAEALRFFAQALRRAADARAAADAAGAPGDDEVFLRTRVRDVAAHLAATGGEPTEE